ncbi:PRD domain-containing protein [Collinsella vaginalis]|uniref:PRD domain-containing protein n=1 Tax=Collinsella vaginalis TaxID=1870987 RepID=UPI000A26C4D6|nr:PRD domain-containing protein [Collinsella vaginalis]
MLITKKINNNVAMARDDRGNELVVFGKGVGFPKTPYLLTDESAVQGVFSNVNDGILSLVRSISGEVIDASLEIMDAARTELEVELNPNAFLTLADHLQFAAERVEGGYEIGNPLAGTVKVVYPREFALGERGLAIVRDTAGIELPASEATSIAMHIVNAEDGAAADMDEIMRTLKTIDGVTAIIERSFETEVDRGSYSYARFTTHLRLLIRRLLDGDISDASNPELLSRIAEDFPAFSSCADEICHYLGERYARPTGDEEKLYLMMHINRFISSR